MFRAFNLRIADNPFDLAAVEGGRKHMAALRPGLRQRMRDSLRGDGSLDGEHLRRTRFPGVRCQVFISHSHRDVDAALGLAGWLASNLGVAAFVDSGVWGHADELLAEIDDEHCRNNGRSTYNYAKRNRSTAHVHAMLSTALASMMDETECLIFMNTSSSVPLAGSIDETDSPWIFVEIEAANRMRRRPVHEHRGIKLAKARLDEGDLRIFHQLQLENLTEINVATLRDWQAGARESDGTNPLDVLYGLAPCGGDLSPIQKLRALLPRG